MNAAEVLERVLDGDDVPPEQTTEEVGRAARLAAVLSHHVAAPPVAMRSEARTELRDRLLTEAALQRTARPLRARWRERVRRDVEGWAHSTRMAGVSGVAAIPLSAGGMAVATDTSLPGDPLHGLELVVEDVRLAFAAGGLPHADGLLDRADARVAEVERAVQAGRMDAAAEALHAVAVTAREGTEEYLAIHAAEGDDAVLVELATWAVHLRERVTRLDDVAGPALLARADLLSAIDGIERRVGCRIRVCWMRCCRLPSRVWCSGLLDPLLPSAEPGLPDPSAAAADPSPANPVPQL